MLAVHLILTVLLAICLLVTTGALVLSSVSIGGNVFTTATFDIELYNGDGVLEGPVITADDGYLFEPGMTVKKPFTLKNAGTVDAYFRIYFEGVTGGLADVLEVKITDANDVVLYDWDSMTNMLEANAQAADRILMANSELELYIWFHMPEDMGNTAKNMTLAFDLCADAVQVKNNAGKEFGTAAP